MGTGCPLWSMRRSLPTCSFLRHCLVALRRHPRGRAVLDPTRFGMRKIRQYLAHSGSHLTVRDLSRLIADAYTRAALYGPEHLRTLTAPRACRFIHPVSACDAGAERPVGGGRWFSGHLRGVVWLGWRRELCCGRLLV
jgi:hypothetical protein